MEELLALVVQSADHTLRYYTLAKSEVDTGSTGKVVNSIDVAVAVAQRMVAERVPSDMVAVSRDVEVHAVQQTVENARRTFEVVEAVRTDIGNSPRGTVVNTLEVVWRKVVVVVEVVGVVEMVEGVEMGTVALISVEVTFDETDQLYHIVLAKAHALIPFLDQWMIQHFVASMDRQ